MRSLTCHILIPQGLVTDAVLRAPHSETETLEWERGQGEHSLSLSKTCRGCKDLVWDPLAWRNNLPEAGGEGQRQEVNSSQCSGPCSGQ